MLHYNTITAETLELLKKLQAVPAFSELRLVGGTALALQIGHRNSIDIDLFGKLSIDEIALNEALSNIGKLIQLKKSKNINIYSLNNIKLDIVNYPYQWIGQPIKTDTLLLAGLKDIAAMKLAAITSRGTKKDFIDVFFLLNRFSLPEMLDFYENKYHDGSVFLVLKSLTYFEDADQDETPKMYVEYDWEKTKSKIINEISKLNQ
jgi:hypothetical protein